VYLSESTARRGRLGGQLLSDTDSNRSPDRDEPARGTRAAELSLLIAGDAMVVTAVTQATGSAPTAAVAVAMLTVAGFAAAGLYRPRLRFSALDDTVRVLLGVAGAVTLAGWMWSAGPVGTAVAIGAGALAVLMGRGLTYRAVRLLRRNRPGEPAIVIGTGDLAIQLAEALHDDPAYGLRPRGLVGSPPLPQPALPVPLLGPADSLGRILADHRPRHVIVAFPGLPDADLVDALRGCRHDGVTVHVVPRLFELTLGRCDAELVRGIPLIRLPGEPARLRRWAIKRIIDITGAAVGLVLLAPVLALCALAVRWESGAAGVLFRQQRIGRDGVPFSMLKFRSLTPSSEHESQVRWSISDDDRLGPVGRLLRVSSLDELPQLLNVLRGDMSLVGPRPERPFFVEQFQRLYGGYADRHRVPAGITGWAQIHGLRGDTSIEERVRFDNYYIENWSLGLDLKIVIRTVGSMLSIHRA
jgi:exopolysaccharide biosynthesis polyprenyl glycosylphosphotransferase